MPFLCGNFLAWPLNCILATKYPWWGKLGPMISCMAWSSECPMPQWLPPWRQRCLPLNVPLPYSCLFPCGLSLSCFFSFHYFLHNKFLPPPDALSFPRERALPGSWGNTPDWEVSRPSVMTSLCFRPLLSPNPGLIILSKVFRWNLP